MAEKPRAVPAGKHTARAVLGRSPLKGEHDLDRWREEGGLQSAFRTQVTWPGASPSAALLLPAWAIQNRSRVPASAFLEHPIKSRFLGPTRPSQNLSVGPGGLYFFKLPGDCTFRVESWCLIALHLLFPLAGSPSSSFSTSLNFRLCSHVSV